MKKNKKNIKDHLLCLVIYIKNKKEEDTDKENGKNKKNNVRQKQYYTE